ncbi:MAG: hypothetical protein WDO16_25320 [Bacteroidota bacterium]
MKSLPPALLGHVKQENTWILTVDILEKMFTNLDQLDNAGHKFSDFVVFFEPPALDERIYNQFAYFSVCSNPTLLIDQWLLKYPDFWQKVIIPKKLKWEIRDKLDQRNISERILFPGMAGLADWLKRYYLPTGSAKSSRFPVPLIPPKRVK